MANTIDTRARARTGEPVSPGMRRGFVWLVLLTTCVPVAAQSEDLIQVLRQRERQSQELQSENPLRGNTPILWPEYSPNFESDGKGMPARRAAERPGVISSRHLAHKPLKAARREFELGIQAGHKGRLAEAFQHLTEAVRLDPAYLEALNELGSRHLQNGEPQAALEYLERALAIDGNSADVVTNQTWALLALGRLEEAERAARRAVQLAPDADTGHYQLGIVLTLEGRITPETAEQLALAAKKHPEAVIPLAYLRSRLAPVEVAQP